MRDDLDKLLCERERSRSWDHYSNYRNLKKFEQLHNDDYDAEDFERPFASASSGSRESMKFRYGWNAKGFGENLNPLYGLIRKSVGRPWNKVYSELCRVFDPRSTTGKHILQHVYDQLARPENTYINESGNIYVRNPYRVDEQIADTYFTYYVDPRDGIIKRNVARKTHRQRMRDAAERRAVEEAKSKRVIDAETELHLINGAWFEVKFQTFKANAHTVARTYGGKSIVYHTEYIYPLMYDVLKRTHVYAPKVAVSKRTLNRRELKKHDLAS